MYYLHGLVGLLGRQDGVAHAEVVVDHAVGEPLPADPDALEHTVAGELQGPDRNVYCKMFWLQIPYRVLQRNYTLKN